MSNGPNASFLIESLLSEIKEALDLPLLELRLNEDWGSHHPHGRLALREALSQLTNENHRDLSAPPRSSSLSISVSHCALLGGFVYTPKPTKIGLDIEIIERAKEPVVKRISAPQEFSLAPTPALLWAAKEATFKSLIGPHQPPVLSDIVIGEWLSFGQVFGLEGKVHNAWKFQASLSQTDALQGTGLVFYYSKFVMALFCGS